MILRYFIAWFGMMLLAIINGAFRDLVYKSHVGNLAAHQLSTVALLLLFAGYFWVLARVQPLKSASQAWQIGGMWFLMTEAFEFAMGRLISGEPWSKLFYAYNLLEGQVWLFIPLWVLVGPYLFHRITTKRRTAKNGNF